MFFVASLYLGLCHLVVWEYPLHTLDFDHRSFFQRKIFTDLITHVVFQGLKKLKVIVSPNLGLSDCIFISHLPTSLHIYGSTCYP